MTRRLRRLIGRIPFARQLRDALVRRLEDRRMAKLGGAREVFEHHYRQNEWGDSESVSGPGSTLEYTENLRAHLPDLCEKYGVSSLLDAPCGDFNWMRHVEWKRPMRYVGGEIVPDLVKSNQQRYGDDSRTFLELDIVRDPLPSVDLWMCRDVLIHLSNADIFTTVANFLRSDIRYLFTTSHHALGGNHDIRTGNFHAIRLQAAPFNFGEPLEEVVDWIAPYPPRSVCLWDRETLAQRLAGHKQVQAALEAFRS